MQTTRLDIFGGSPDKFMGAEIRLTFKHFIAYLETRVEQEQTVKKDFFAHVLRKFKARKRLEETMQLEETAEYPDELALLYSLLVPIIGQENEELWALSLPLSPGIFYGTSSFYTLLRDDLTNRLKCGVANIGPQDELSKMKLNHIYSFIVKKLFHVSLPATEDILYTLQNEGVDMPRYFKINVDTRFIEVYPVAELPKINFEELQQSQQLQGHFDWEGLLQKLPISLFRFEGFSILTVTDVTAAQALENIKSIILNHADSESGEYYNQVIISLQALAGTADVKFDLLPALRINDRLVFDDEACRRSLMVRTCGREGNGTDDLEVMANQFLTEPKVFFFRNITDTDVSNTRFLKRLKFSGIVSYALVPIYYNNKVAGVLEAYSTQKDMLDETVLSKMDQAAPLLAQLLQQRIDSFNTKIQSVIKERFTSLQPAVQWKFNEVAWHYLRDSEGLQKKATAENILFKNVYPLYAAVDIRNSTQERNTALRADLRVQLNTLTDAIKAIKKVQNIAIADELLFKCSKWLKVIEEKRMDDDHSLIKDFLDYEVNDFLNYFKEATPELGSAIGRYFEAVNEQNGSAYANRRALEVSIQTINSAVNQYLEMFKAGAQESYPCYFEKFRTDGVEFDMYIGQSISPEKPFNLLYLKNLRLWQLGGMAAITKLTHSLMPTLVRKLQTTQLIFIHSNSIDISFRNDERRFDVEGGYNIRYQVIKKRIDKVNIRNTNQRLTQPGKIALVYFNKKEADEYVEYIHYLQEKGTLLPGIEYLDLEELQGVSGLKALRVGVAVEETGVKPKAPSMPALETTDSN